MALYLVSWLVILICRALKVVITRYMMTSRRLSIDKNLSSVGDALASFLQYLDINTERDEADDMQKYDLPPS